MSELDVVIIGGYGLTEKVGGDTQHRDAIRLSYKGRPATVDFLRSLVRADGDLPQAERDFFATGQAKFTVRSLNTIYLYDFLTKQGLNVAAVNYFRLEPEKFRALMAERPKVVAISTTFISDANEIVEIARAVRELSPDSVIIAGGVKILKSYKKLVLAEQGYFAGFDMDALRAQNFFFNPVIDEAVDVFVVEECGELTLLEIVRKIKAGRPYRDTANIAYRDGGTLLFTERVPEPFTFDQSPISWDAVPEDIVGLEIPVRAGTGCPHQCGFCDFVKLHQVRVRPLDNIICELRAIQKAFPGRPIYFADDNLFVTRKRTTQLAQAIIDSGLNFKWRAFFRADAVSENNAELLARSGCYMAFLGVESGDDRILANMRKRSKSGQTLRAVGLLNGAGINTLSTLIVGFPGETDQTVDSTIDLLNSYPQEGNVLNLYYPFSFVLTPLAPIAAPESMHKWGLSGGYGDWRHSTMDSAGAQAQLDRMFREVDGPPLLYPEHSGSAGLSPSELGRVGRTRDQLVKSGITTINEQTASQVCTTFKPLFA